MFSKDRFARSSGLMAGIAAFSIWGMLVLYWQALKGVPAPEILAHRVLWSLACIAPLLLLTRRFHEARQAVGDRKTLLRVFCSSTLIAANWLIFIHTVTHGKVLEASLGYFMHPLASVLVGAVFLRERPERLQALAIILVAAGVLWRVAAYGDMPWMALGLTATFSLYSLMRKTMAVESAPGLFLETAIMAPFAAGYLVWLHYHGQGSFFSLSAEQAALLAGTGLITSTPMLLFTYAARHMKLSTLGFTQYISPTITFVIGACVLGEPVTAADVVTFASIWCALAIYSWCGWRAMRGHSGGRQRQ